MTARKSTTGGKGGRKYKGLPPKGSQRISLERAVDLTQRYRKAAPASEHGGFFWADGLKELLAQPNVVGLRYYHGLDAEGCYQIVFVGVDQDGRDVVKISRPRPRSAGGQKTMALIAGAGDSALLDNHHTCPPWCDPTSPLF